MIINHNIGAMMACRYMNIHSALASRAMQRISSGRRINSAADDPAGLCISVRMEAQIRGLQQASRNAQNGISLVQVADGALSETDSMLQRLRELAVRASSDTLTTQDRKNTQLEVDQLTIGINNIALDTQFNTIKVFDPGDENYGGANKLTVQIGANVGQVIDIPIQDMKSSALKISDALGNALDVSTAENASLAIKSYDDAINQVSSSRASYGAVQNALEYRVNYLDTTSENLTVAESRITDADIAKEMMEYTKENILTQVCQLMFVQANHQSESVIELLKSLYR